MTLSLSFRSRPRHRSLWAVTAVGAFLLVGIATGTQAQDTAPPQTFDLKEILSNKGDAGLAAVQDDALAQSKSTPFYKSNGVETREYDGYFLASKDTTKLAVLSDDGTSVWIDGQNVLDEAGHGHGFDQPEITFFPLNATFQAGHVYHLHLRYTNIAHDYDTDIDGLTLFAYDGGGVPTSAPKSK